MPEGYLTTLAISPEEKRLVKLKYSATPFKNLDEATLTDISTRFLLSVSVVTGWEVPNELPFYEGGMSALDMLIHQLQQFLTERYPTLNINEVDYAFRNYPVKEWGKQMNLALIDEVLNQYSRDRRAASDAEQTVAARASPQLPQPELTDEEKIEFGRWTFMYMHSPELIYNCYEQLRRTGKLAKPTPEQCQVLKQQAHSRRLVLKQTSGFFDFLDERLWSKMYMQKLAVVEYFKNESHAIG